MTRIFRHAISDDGFTLIELLVVVALIGVIALTALPNVSSYFRISLNSATREIATLVREAYNSAVMTGRVHRIVYDLDKDQYWVEVGPSTVLLATEESQELDESRARFKREEDQPPPETFKLDETITDDRKSLPRGARFADVITEQSLQPVTEGLAYTHLFPHGISEQTIVRLTDNSEHEISLVISPVVGKTTLFNGHVDGKDIFGDLVE